MKPLFGYNTPRPTPPTPGDLVNIQQHIYLDMPQRGAHDYPVLKRMSFRIMIFTWNILKKLVHFRGKKLDKTSEVTHPVTS
jgi:hypothetical protein